MTSRENQALAKNAAAGANESQEERKEEVADSPLGSEREE